MIQEIVSYLINNPDVLKQINEGTANLIGVTAEEQNAIVSILSSNSIRPTSYWSI